MPISVWMLGDSTLDNNIWVMKKHSTPQEDKENSVEGQLEKAINPIPHLRHFQIINHAYDGFTTRSLLEGDTIGRVLRGNPYYARYMKEKVSGESNLQIHPLEKLPDAIKKDKDGIHYVVLSLGGNDFRENLSNPWKFIKDIAQIQNRYLQIVEKIKGLGGKNIRPILVFQYRTDHQNDVYGVYKLLGYIGQVAAAVQALSIAILGVSAVAFLAKIISAKAAILIGGLGALFVLALHVLIPLDVSMSILRRSKDPGVAVIGTLMKRFYAPILQQAERDRIPILDLPNTFNPFDESLYLSGIEPSKKGGGLIAEGIAHIIEKHDYNEVSKIYSKTNRDKAYTAVENSGNSSWNVKYPEH